MKPIYVAKKSAWRAITPLRIIFWWLFIPIIVMIVRAIQLKHEIIEFYPDKVVQRSGVLAKREKRSAFTGVIGSSVEQGVLGRMLHYGDVNIDVTGKWDIKTDGVKDPYKLQAFLDAYLLKASNFNVVNTVLG